MKIGAFCFVEILLIYYRRYCLVNSLECYSQRLLFESALSQLDQEGILKNKTCAELSRFVTLLDQLLAKELNTVYLIFDKAERLRGEFQFIVNALLRLTEQVLKWLLEDIYIVYTLYVTYFIILD